MGDTDVVEFETTRINMWHVGAIMLGIATNAVAVGVVYANFTRDIEDLNAKVQAFDNERLRRAVQVDNNIGVLNSAIQPLSTYTFRLGQLEARSVKTDERIDRVVETIGAKIDTMSESVNSLRTDVRALAVKIDLPGKEAKRTRFTTLP